MPSDRFESAVAERRALLTGLAAMGAVFGFAGPAAAQQAACPPSPAKDLLERYHDRVWKAKDLAAIPDFIAADFRSHGRPADAPRGPAPMQGFLQMFFTAFPDIASTHHARIGEGDLVAVLWTIAGTHRGLFMGKAPTGRRIDVMGIDVLRAHEGKFVEHWGGLGDQFPKILRQLDG